MNSRDKWKKRLTRKGVESSDWQLHVYELQVLAEPIQCDAGICSGEGHRDPGVVSTVYFNCVMAQCEATHLNTA